MLATFMTFESNHRAVMWKVRDGNRWWTVCFLTADGSYCLTSDAGREIKPTRALGKNLIAATVESGQARKVG